MEKGSDPNWKDKQENSKNSYEIVVSMRHEEAFRLLVEKRYIFEEEAPSAIYLAVNRDKVFFEIVFNKLKEMHDNNEFNPSMLVGIIHDSIKKIVDKDSKEMMEKMFELGVDIVDQEKNNLISDKKKVFSFLISNVEKEDVLLDKNNRGKVAIEEAQFKKNALNDDFYIKAIRKRLGEMGVAVNDLLVPGSSTSGKAKPTS